MELKQSPSILFIVIYKPPQNSEGFIDNFTEMLSVVCTEFDAIVITGDFNVHVDIACERKAKELCADLEAFGPTQHLSDPTHSRGHTLDLLMTHFFVFLDMSVRRRHINDTTETLFVKMIECKNVLCSDVDNLLNSLF